MKQAVKLLAAVTLLAGVAACGAGRRDASDVNYALTQSMNSNQITSRGEALGEVAAETNCQPENVDADGMGTYICDVRLAGQNEWHKYRVNYFVKDYDRWTSTRVS